MLFWGGARCAGNAAELAWPQVSAVPVLMGVRTRAVSPSPPRGRARRICFPYSSFPLPSRVQLGGGFTVDGVPHAHRPSAGSLSHPRDAPCRLDGRNPLNADPELLKDLAP
jgi:hypothetical protein